ncbi:hypothetical protein [Salipiger abyssi]|uniref:hypothetical protein n=1 Tax=Salipiger abyssi TaxID=1250539 RepID=UPI00097656F3|nr:hypothetical protein [Salipiger abyssi]
MRIFYFGEDLLDLLVAKALAPLVKWHLAAMEKRDGDAASRQKEQLQALHRLFARAEGALLALMPVVAVIALLGVTYVLSQSCSDWASLQRFGVVWIVLSLLIVFWEIKDTDRIVHFKAIHRLFRELPKECRFDGEDELYKSSVSHFLKFRKGVELLSVLIGTLMTGYGDLILGKVRAC